MRVLVADTREATRAFFRAACALLPGGEVVAEAGDGEEAAQLALERDVDAALLSSSLARLDGLTVAQLIRRYRAGTLVVLYATTAATADRAEAKRLGIDFVASGRPPARIESLRDVVRAAVAGGPRRGVAVVGADGRERYRDAVAARLLRSEAVRRREARAPAGAVVFLTPIG